MKLTAKELLNLGIVDEVIDEPLGGAHRDNKEMSTKIKKSILKNLETFKNLSGEEIFNQRKTKFLKIGRDQGFRKDTGAPDGNLAYTEPGISKITRFIQ